MEVTVEVSCGRCAKKEKRALSLEEAQALGVKTDRKAELESELQESLNKVLSSDHPDVVIAVRNESGGYDVKHLDSLCDVPDAKRNKGCKNRVDTLLGDIFMTNEPSPKKKKPAVKKKPTPTPPVQGDTK